MQSGELIVTGHNSVNIDLIAFPAEVHVKFKHDLSEPAPCNPGNVDVLTYTVQTVTNIVVLTISWNVSAIREIIWYVSY